MKHHITLSISEELLQEIDLRKGLVTRSVYVEHILRRNLEADKNAQN